MNHKRFMLFFLSILIALSLFGCSTKGDKVNGKALYDEFRDCGLFLPSDKLSLNVPIVKGYMEIVTGREITDSDIQSYIDDINAYLKSEGKEQLLEN